MYQTEVKTQWPVQPAIVYGIPTGVSILNINKYQCQQSVINGLLQIVIGVACIVVNAVSIGIYIGWAVVSYGIWSGVYYIVTGIFGILAGKMMNKCTMITFMVLCIISASLFFPAHFIMAVFGAVLEFNDLLEYNDSEKSETLGILNIVLSILAGIEFIFAVWGSFIWCRTVGCCRSQSVESNQATKISNGQPFVHQVYGQGGHYANTPYTAQIQHYPQFSLQS